MDKSNKMAEILRQAAIADGRSMYRLARDASISYAILHSFMQGDKTGRKRNISIETADRLAKSLGLELRPKKKGR